MTEILLYTIFIKDEKSGRVYNKGLYENKPHASLALNRIAEEYCIRKCGEENFVKDQLIDTSISDKITDGLVLKRTDNTVEVTKRIAGYFVNGHENYATITVVPIYQDTQTVTLPMENVTTSVVERIIDPVNATKVVINKKDRKVVKKSARCEELSKSQENTPKENLMIELKDFVNGGRSLRPAHLNPRNKQKNPLSETQVIYSELAKKTELDQKEKATIKDEITNITETLPLVGPAPILIQECPILSFESMQKLSQTSQNIDLEIVVE
jgi:hypothetical protein